ncbi:hypothetical protein V8E51_004833 [Hyaloscypha variabilis]
MAATLPSVKNSTINGTTIRKTKFTGCTFRHAEIFGSTIAGSTLSNVKLSNCTIDNSTLTQVHITNCTVVSSSLLDSKLHETKIANCSMDNCTMTSSALALRKFPPEIRAMIFNGCIHFGGFKTPAIIITLRGDKQMYEEAIQIFYKLNWFRVRLQNLEDFEAMSIKAIQGIRKLVISTMFAESLVPGVFPESFSSLTSVEKLELWPYSREKIKVWAKACVVQFPSLEILVIGMSCQHLSTRPNRLSQSMFNAVFELEQNLGSPPRLFRVSSSRIGQWYWQASKSQKLKWADDQEDC